MLQGWISDSEKTVPTPVPPPATAPAAAQPPASKSPGKNFILDEHFILNS